MPEEKGFSVGDIKIDGREIIFGGQVADGIRIKVTGMAQGLGQAPLEPERGCIGDSTNESIELSGPMPRLRR